MKASLTKTPAKTPFFTTHFTLYLGSWRRTLKPRTAWLAGLDLLLFLVLVLFLSFNMAATNALSAPVQPALQAIAQLETSGATTEEKIALAEAYTPVVNQAILQIILVATVFFLLFLVIYALVKTRIWAAIRDEPFTWPRCGWNLLTTTVWLLIVILAPYGLLFLNELAATLLFLLLAALTLCYLPLFYAAGSWRSFLRLFRWRPLRNYLFVLLLSIVTWVVIGNLLGLFSMVSVLLATVLLLLWVLLFCSWGRHYLDGFVKTYGEVRHA